MDMIEIENRLSDSLLMRLRRNNIEYNRKQLETIKECLIELEQKYKTLATHTYIANILRGRLDNVLIPELLAQRFYSWNNIKDIAYSRIKQAGFSDSYGNSDFRHYTLDKTNSETTIYEPHEDDTIYICAEINGVIPHTIIRELDTTSALIRMIEKSEKHRAYLGQIWQNNYRRDDITDEFIEGLDM